MLEKIKKTLDIKRVELGMKILLGHLKTPLLNPYEKAYIITGAFISQCALLEYQLNYAAERLFVTNTQVRRVQRLDVLDRWMAIRSKAETESADKAITTQKTQQIDAVIAYFEANIKELRNLLAHSPMASDHGSKPYILQSRRHQPGGKNYATIPHIRSLLVPFSNQLEILVQAIPGLDGKPFQSFTFQDTKYYPDRDEVNGKVGT